MKKKEERLVHADRGRDVMYRRMVRSAADILRNIHSPLGGSGERQESRQKRLAALYASQEWSDLVTCLFVPRTLFQKPIPPVFYSIAGHFPRLSPGARSLLQLSCERTLILVIRSAWKALRHYGPRKTLACEDLCVMVDILEPFIAPLQVALPAELKTALDQEDTRTSGRRRDMQDSDQADEDANVEGRGRGQSARSRRRSRSRDSRRDARSRGS